MSKRQPTADDLRARRYYIERARVKKAMKAEAILVPEKMTEYALKAVMDECLRVLLAHASDGRDVEAAVCARKALECWCELQLRGTQLELA